MYTRPYTLIRKILHTIFLLSIVNSVLGLHGAPTVHAQDSQPIPLLTTNNVESPVPTASVGNIGTSFSTATLLGITGSPTGDFDYHGVNGVGNTSIEHYYKIAIGKTGVVKFRIVTALQSNHILRLYDNNYVLLDTGKDESCGLFCTYWNRKTISYNFTSTGIYFLRATYEDSIYLNYYLSWDYDGSSSSKALDVTGWDPGHPIEGFNDDRSYDWYFTNFSGGLYLRFSLLSDVGSNFNLYVYDQSNTSTPIASSTTTGIDIVDFTTPPSSVQYIKVVKATGSGGYRLEVSTPPPLCYTLTRSYTGSGSQPTANPANSTGCSSGQYTAGQSITMTAYPASGYSVGSWSGTNNNSSTSTTNTVTMPASALTVTANYVAIPPTCYTLTRSYTGSGSQPTANPANSTGCSSGQYTAGQSIAVTAYPASGYSVGSWSGTNNNSSTSTTNTVTMPASSHTVTANYVAIPSMNGPSGLTATPISSSQINLGWTDNSSDETNFRVERSPDGSTGWTEIGSAAANSPSYSSTGLSTCTTYYYRVRAYRSSDGAYSSYSNTASTTSTGCSLNAPSGLTATPISASQINLSWTDNSSDETNFRGELSLNGSTGWTEIGTVVANTTSASTIGLSACTTYYFRVRAYRSSDGAYSSYSNIANATTTGCSLNAPSGLTALPISSSQINLGWTDNSSDETNFRVESSPDGSTGWTEIGSVVANSPSYLSTGLSACTTYYYRVRAYRSSDGAYSSYGNTASATTIGCSLNAPSGLTAIPISASQINLSWTDNSSDETNFRVESSPDGSTGWTEIGSVVANSPSYSSTGLSACTTYYYRVRAYRSSDGAYSSYGNTANAQTSGCEPGGFNDVPPTYWAVNWIQRLFNAGITSGCGNGNYCPEDPVTRAQMAVFLERGVHGSDYQPPAVGSGTGFYDVPTEYWAAAWIKQLAADGITSGCGGGNYCPDDPVTRSQMAIFLLRAKYGAAYIPPGVGSNTGFNDVSVTHWAAAWIRQLAAEGITTGCGGGNYCPEDSVTRAQMAVFLVRTFNLP